MTKESFMQHIRHQVEVVVVVAGQANWRQAHLQSQQAFIEYNLNDYLENLPCRPGGQVRKFRVAWSSNVVTHLAGRWHFASGIWRNRRRRIERDENNLIDLTFSPSGVQSLVSNTEDSAIKQLEQRHHLTVRVACFALQVANCQPQRLYNSIDKLPEQRERKNKFLCVFQRPPCRMPAR